MNKDFHCGIFVNKIFINDVRLQLNQHLNQQYRKIHMDENWLKELIFIVVFLM